MIRIMRSNALKEKHMGQVAYDDKTVISGLKEIGWQRGPFQYCKEVCGENVTIGDFTTMHAPFKIGSNVVIGNNCVIGHHAEIGDNVVIDDGCTVPEGVTINAGQHWTFKQSMKAMQ